MASVTTKVFAAILPVLAILCVGCGTVGPVEILSGYGATTKPGGSLRDGAHPAIDFGGSVGDPVLAAADGEVFRVALDAPGRPCGNGIWLKHDFNRYTLYCQLHAVLVKRGERVARGQRIGLLGSTGEPAWVRGVPIPMLHFAVADEPRSRADGDLAGTVDPMSMIVGCFDPARPYPTDRLVLTYPVHCRR
jgi:murein DD-endopeptidase MepM/ murein hydrolase activator NlpD